MVRYVPSLAIFENLVQDSIALPSQTRRLDRAGREETQMEYSAQLQTMHQIACAAGQQIMQVLSLIHI